MPAAVVTAEEDVKAIRAVKIEEIPWLPPSPKNENKFLTRMKENPFVPIGVSCTKLDYTGVGVLKGI